jgi:hypothetical protein
VPIWSSKWDVKSLSKHSNRALKTMVKIATQLYAPADKQQGGTAGGFKNQYSTDFLTQNLYLSWARHDLHGMAM